MTNGYITRQQKRRVCVEQGKGFPVFSKRQHDMGLSYLQREIGAGKV
jgi:hypothetical protein